MHNEYVGRRSVTILLTITHADRVMQGILNTDPQITRTKIYPLPEKQMFLNLTLQPSSTTHPPSLPVRASHPPACQHGSERDRHPVLPAKWVTLVFQALKRWVSGKRAKSGSGWGSSVTDLRVWPGGGTGSSSRQARAVSGCTLRPRATSFCREAKVRHLYKLLLVFRKKTVLFFNWSVSTTRVRVCDCVYYCYNMFVSYCVDLSVTNILHFFL